MVEPLPVRIMLLVDISGSMGIKTGRTRQSKLNYFKKFARNMIMCLDAGDMAGLVTFGDAADALVPFTRITESSRVSCLLSYCLCMVICYCPIVCVW